MTMPDNADADAVEQQQDSLPAVQDDGSAPADAGDEHPPASADDDEHEQDDHTRSRREKRYRLRLREAERERDELRDRLAKTRQAIVGSAVHAAGVDARLMAAAGHTVDTLVGDDGLIDPAKLSEAVANTAREFRITPKGRPPQPNPQQGRASGQPSGKASWSAALKGKQD